MPGNYKQLQSSTIRAHWLFCSLMQPLVCWSRRMTTFPKIVRKCFSFFALTCWVPSMIFSKLRSNNPATSQPWIISRDNLPRIAAECLERTAYGGSFYIRGMRWRRRMWFQWALYDPFWVISHFLVKPRTPPTLRENRLRKLWSLAVFWSFTYTFVYASSRWFYWFLKCEVCVFEWECSK